MGKRKAAAPQKADAVKRQQLTWDMGDLRAVQGLQIMDYLESDPKQGANSRHDLVVGTKATTPSGEVEMVDSGYGSVEYMNTDGVQSLIDECDFHVSVHNELGLKPGAWSCQLGTFSMKLHKAPRSLPAEPEFWLYCSVDPSKQLLYYEISDQTNAGTSVRGKEVVYYEAACDLPYACLDSVRARCFRLVSAVYCPESGELQIAVHAVEAVLTKLKFPSEGCQAKKKEKSLMQLMENFYGIQTPDLSHLPHTKKHDIAALYRDIKARHDIDAPVVRVNVQHPSMKPRLREYQKEAVRWMLARERATRHELFPTDYPLGQGAGVSVSHSGKELHCLYEPVHTVDGQTLYYNKQGGFLVKEKPLGTISPGGGILADEMGLGKTVEVLACILLHRREDLPEVEVLPVIEEEQDSTVPECDEASQSSDQQSQDSIHSSQLVELCTSTSTDSSEACDLDKFCDVDNTEFTVHVKPSDSTVITDINQGVTTELTGCEETCTKPISAQTEDVMSTDVSEVFPPEGTLLPDHTYSTCMGQGEPGRQNPEVVHEASSISVEGKCTSDKALVLSQTDRNSSGSLCGTETAEMDESNSKPKHKKQVKKVAHNIRRSDSSSTDQSATSTEATVPMKRKKPVQKSPDTTTKDKTDMCGTADQQGTFGTSAIPPVRSFECICGTTDREVPAAARVDCCICGLGQHARCVNYDLTDAYRGLYKCPHCHTQSVPIPSGATLIVSPSAICHQWSDEIKKHIREETIEVLVYSGVSKQGYIQPQTLARKHIVLTTYETLRREVNYVDLPHSNSDTGRRLRNPKRFMAVPSPLVAVEWWRVCLDEAQMVETTTTKTADMAMRLKAVNRWCVTGTPVQRGIEDLYGLLLFLGVDPYWVSVWWQRVLYTPFCHGLREPLLGVLHRSLWRTVKQDVLDQVCLPPQTEEVHWLTFSPVEEHFYRRQYQECARDARQRLRKWSDSETRLNSLDRYSLHQLLHPLVRLRQACCHPQAVRGQFLPIHKSTMTMEQLLKQLIRKTQLECEDAHRQWVFALNGLAALEIIMGDYAEAVESYRAVLRSVDAHKSDVRTDDLQQLHTLHNLREILLTKPPGVPPTLRDHQLLQQVREIKTRYIARFEQQVSQAQEAWNPVRSSVLDLTKQLKPDRDWWSDLLQWTLYTGMDQLLVEKVKDDLNDNHRMDTQSISNRFRDVRGLQYVIDSHLEDVQSTHRKLVRAILALDGPPSTDLIEHTVDCCLRPAGKSLKTCPFCKVDEQFQEYETKLFSVVDKGISDQPSAEGEDAGFAVNTKRQGTWADSEVERSLKTIISFARTSGGDRQSVEVGSVHMRLFEALKKEFKCLRTIWLYLRERVSAVDELDMATTRMRLRLPDEMKTDPPQPNILEPAELQPHRLKLQTDRIIGKNELKKKLGQLLYLRNLSTAENPVQGGQNPTPCPICQKELGEKWSVLRCGHCFCLECIRILVEQYSSGGRQSRVVKCPMCRQRSAQGDISYVSTRAGDAGTDADGIKVKGDHSTKLEGIIKCLLKIHRDDPQAKSLVFSTWPDVLDLLATALYENDINYKSLHSANHFQKNLDSFKHHGAVQVLLLPVHSGANGLNLIEATHVLLVEPILNPAQELQAIGRVHRIGQTRPTVVHRFLVRSTIEQKMHPLLHSVQLPTNSHSAEETTLTIGELTSLFSDQTAGEDEGEAEGGPQAVEEPDGSEEVGELNTAQQAEQPSSVQHSEQPNSVQPNSAQQLEQPQNVELSEQLNCAQQLEHPLNMQQSEQAQNVRQLEQTSSGQQVEQPQNVRQLEQTSSGQQLEQPQNVRQSEQTSSGQLLEQPQNVRQSKQTSSGQQLEQPQNVRQSEQTSSEQLLEQPQNVRQSEQTSSGQLLEQPQNVRQSEQTSSGQQLEQPQNVRQSEQTSSGQQLEKPQNVQLSEQSEKPPGAH